MARAMSSDKQITVPFTKDIDTHNGESCSVDHDLMHTCQSGTRRRYCPKHLSLPCPVGTKRRSVTSALHT